MESILKLNSKLFYRLLIFFIGISICIRSFYHRLYGNHAVEFFVLFSLCILNIFLCLLQKQKIKITIPLLFSIFALFNFIGVDSINRVNLFFYIVCICIFFSITNKSDVLVLLVKIIVYFAIITSTVTWISYLFPDIYIDYIVNIFSNDIKLEVLRYFTKNGHYMGLTSHYSRNAFYVVSALIFLTPYILDRNIDKKYYIVFSYLILTLLLIGKRGHTLFFMISFYIMMFFNEKSSKQRVKNIIKWSLILLVAIILILIFIPQVNTLFERLTNSSGDATSGRGALYEIAIDMFKYNPILGNGYGSFARRVNFRFAAVHNDYLQILAENGVIGFIIMIGFNLSCYIYSIKAIKITNYKNIYAKMSFMFQTFILLYSFTGLPRYDYEIMTLYFIMCVWSVEIFTYNYIKKRSLYMTNKIVINKA